MNLYRPLHIYTIFGGGQVGSYQVFHLCPHAVLAISLWPWKEQGTVIPSVEVCDCCVSKCHVYTLWQAHCNYNKIIGLPHKRPFHPDPNLNKVLLLAKIMLFFWIKLCDFCEQVMSGKLYGNSKSLWGYWKKKPKSKQDYLKKEKKNKTKNIMMLCSTVSLNTRFELKYNIAGLENTQERTKAATLHWVRTLTE